MKARREGATAVAPFSWIKRRAVCRDSGKALYTQVAKKHGAAGIMALEGESALTEDALEIVPCFPVIGLRPFNHRLAVHFGDDFLAVHLDVHFKPCVVLGGGFQGILHAIDAGCFLGVMVGVVHLALEARLRPSFILVFCVEIDASVSVGEGHHFGLELEVFEGLFGFVEEMAATWGVGHDATIAYSEGLLVFIGFPTLERFAVEEAFPVCLNFV